MFIPIGVTFLRKIIDKCDSLSKSQSTEKYYTLLKKLQKVRHSVFGIKPNLAIADFSQYQGEIDDFIVAYKATGLNPSPKVHILQRHAVEFMQKFNMTLGK